MQVSDDRIDQALLLFAKFCRYPKIVDAELILTYSSAFARVGMTADEFGWATAKLIEDCDDFPTPHDFIELVKSERARIASLPNVESVKSLPAANRSTVGPDGRKTHNANGELLVTPEFHYARAKKMIEAFDRMDAERGSPPNSFQLGLRKFWEGVAARA